MRFMKWCRLAVVAAFVVVAAPAMAQNCAGFTDVSAADPNCASFEWLKNRQITTGCTATTYCPTLNVTRAQMALFMHRLGKVITPTDLPPVAQDSQNVAVDLNNASNRIRCQTSDIPPVGYPRRATFNSKVNLYNPTAHVDILAEMVYTVNGGVTWIAVPDSKTYQTLRSGNTPVDDVSTYQLGNMDLDTVNTYRFALRVQRNPDIGNPGTGNVAIYCINRISLWSRNPTSSPYDAAYEIGYVPPPEDRQGRAALPPAE